MKKLIEKIWGSIGSKTILLGLVTAAVALCFYDPTSNEAITLWKRTFSQAALAGIDVGKRISNFYFLIVILFPVVCAVCFSLYSLLFAKLGWNPNFKSRSPHFEEILNKRLPSNGMRQLAGLGVFAFFSVVVSLFSKICIPFLAERSDIYRQMLPSVLPDAMTVVFIVGMLVSFVQLKKSKDHEINVYEFFAFFTLSAVSLSLIIPVGFTACAVATGVLLALIPASFISRDSVKNAEAVLMWHVAAFCILMEAFFTFSEKGFLHINFRIIAVCSWVILIAFGILVSRIGKIKNWLSSHRVTVACLGGLVSLSVLGRVGIAYSFVWNYRDFAYIYEMGNKMVAVDTLQQGALPVLDYFSAHSIYDVWTQILHGFIHGDVIGMLIAPYEGLTTVLCSVVLFFLLKKLFNPYFAFLTLAFFPVDTLGLKTYTLCLVAVLLHLWLSKKECAGKYGVVQLAIFWLLIAANAFFIYDDGIALGIGAIFCMLVVYGCRRDWRSALRFLSMGAAVGIIVLALCILYCHWTGVNFTNRMSEWLALSAGSNAFWATTEFGDPHKFSYYYSYFLLPFAASFIFIFTTTYCLKNRKVSIFAALSIIFALAELLCMSRGIVWHNLWSCNGTTGRLLNFSHFTCSFFAMFLATRKREFVPGLAYGWLIAVACCIWMSNAVVTFYLPNTSSALYNHSVAASDAAHNAFQEEPGQKRYSYDAATEQLLNGFSEVFDAVLKDDETFLDFANMTALYPMVGRTRPFYVAQSPSLLTSDFSVQRFLEQVSSHKVPLALTGLTAVPYTQSIGGVPHNVRYYKVAEKIYNDYVPLTQVGDFAVWCEKEKFKEYSQKLNARDNIKWNDEYFHVDLEMLPYVWANYDEERAVQSEIFTEISEQDSVYSLKLNFRNLAGTYMHLKIESLEASNAEIFFSQKDNPESEYSFKFKLLPGKNDYLIRASMNQNFYLYGINLAKISCENCKVVLFGATHKSGKFLMQNQETAVR